MKKKYTKPYIVLESFQLDAAIASSCSSSGKMPIHYGVNTCTPFEELPGLAIMGLACAELGSDVVNNPDGYDGFCYHGPLPETDVSTIFMNS